MLFKNRENFLIYNDIVCEKSVSVGFYSLLPELLISVFNEGSAITAFMSSVSEVQ